MTFSTRVLTDTNSLSIYNIDDFRNCLFKTDFLRFIEIEHQGRVEPSFFLALDNNEEVGFSVGYRQAVPIPLTFNPQQFMQEVADTDIREMSSLMMHVPYRLRSDILIKNPEKQSLITNLILDDVTNYAKECSDDFIVFPFVCGTRLELIDNLCTHGFLPCFYEADFFIDTNHQSYDCFLRNLNKNYRQQYYNDYNRLKRSNIKIVKASFEDVRRYSPLLLDFHLAHMHKYGHLESEFTASSFINLVSSVQNSCFFLAFNDTELEGFSFGIYDEDTFHCLRCCQNPMRTVGAHTYFNLLFNEPIREAISLGCKRVHFGKASHRAKLVRGCKYETGIAFFKFLKEEMHDLMAPKIKKLDTLNRERFAHRLNLQPQ